MRPLGRRNVGVLVLVIGLALPVSAPAQQAPVEEFGEELDVVEVLLDVLVTDKSGQVIIGLGKDDFTVTNRVTGGRIPAQIWQEAMAPLHIGEPVIGLKQRGFGRGYGIAEDGGYGAPRQGWLSSLFNYRRARRPDSGYGQQSERPRSRFGFGPRRRRRWNTD